MKKHAILFLAANPAGLTARKLDEEARQIEEEIRRANHRDRFEFISRLAARPIDLLRALREVRPSVVHFTGHAGASGLYLMGEQGQPKQVTREALHATFGAAGQSVQVVVLNGCATADVAAVLCDVVPVCVGTSAASGDTAGRAFSVGFYGALACGESAARSCAQGRAAMHLEVVGDHDRPLLHYRGDVDPEALVLADADAVEPDVPALAPAPSHALQLAAVIERYRARKSGSFERWDLRTAGPAPTSNNRPAEITLDEMYISLRFAPEIGPAELDRSKPILPDDLLALPKRHVVIGPAGSGKTTWMRWTFRRLIGDPRALPFFLELRTIAAAWRAPRGATRSIESYLAETLRECGASDPDAIVRALLEDESAPRPVILIDGWDESEASGERLRERLVELCRAAPRVAVIVSSRPYGESRPAGAEAFETLYIQPLSDDDIRLLTTRFYRCVHGQDEPASARATEEIMAELAAVPEARALAGTALLLTMLLLLSREGPLPDRRHKLYTACLRNMLLHRVAERERTGVVVDHDQQWRPDDGEERLRIVAELAYRMQTEGLEPYRRAPMVRTWEQALALLGHGWTRDQRERFLRWLVATAGVLVDRTDGSIQFAHLSFQEHLAAYYLFISCEGEERIAAVRLHMREREWWETLRLWAGLIDDQWPAKLRPVLDILRAEPHAYWLAGEMFADGTGVPADFESWVTELPARLSDPSTWWSDCALTWAMSKQEVRRKRITAVLAAVQGRFHWLEGIWHAYWAQLAKLEVPPAAALRVLEAPVDCAAAAARSRVLHGAAASWPDGGELAVLRLWPSPRVALGVRLQAALSLGAKTSEIVTILPGLLEPARQLETLEGRRQAANLGSYLAAHLNNNLAPAFSEHFFGYYIKDFAVCFIRCFGMSYAMRSRSDSRQLMIRPILRYFDRNIIRARYFGPYFIRNFGRYLVDDPDRFMIWNMVLPFTGSLGIPESGQVMPWLSTFAGLEISSIAGRAATRASLAQGDLPEGDALLALFGTACRASFEPEDARLLDAVARACETFDGDLLWPALARHIARMSTVEDRALLEDLARHPEKRDAPLSWGLQHYVRGDLVLDDDSVVTLDELCAMAGLPPLPFLEDMPDEIAISVNDAPP